MHSKNMHSKVEICVIMNLLLVKQLIMNVCVFKQAACLCAHNAISILYFMYDLVVIKRLNSSCSSPTARDFPAEKRLVKCLVAFSKTYHQYQVFIHSYMFQICVQDEK